MPPAAPPCPAQVISVSYFFDKDYYDDPAHAVELGNVQRDKYVAGAREGRRGARGGGPREGLLTVCAGPGGGAAGACVQEWGRAIPGREEPVRGLECVRAREPRARGCPRAWHRLSCLVMLGARVCAVVSLCAGATMIQTLRKGSEGASVRGAPHPADTQSRENSEPPSACVAWRGVAWHGVARRVGARWVALVLPYALAPRRRARQRRAPRGRAAAPCLCVPPLARSPRPIPPAARL
jgi:hypothetical protein